MSGNFVNDANGAPIRLEPAAPHGPDPRRVSGAKIIGLAGLNGAGKSTAAAVLMRRGWARKKMADPLKNMMRALYAGMGLTHREIERRIEGDLKETPDPKLCGRTPRHAMETLGTEWAKGLIHPNLWASVWLSSASAHVAAHRHLAGIVCDDVRFPDEFDVIRHVGGAIIGIRRPGLEEGEHVSSKIQAEPDLWLDNDTTPGELGLKVLAAVLPAEGRA